jgi:acyl-CoA synthetase (AMP-forming)/AMP-acid ligase II
MDYEELISMGSDQFSDAKVDPDDREVPSEEMGEIVTRSDLVMKAYWRNPEATAETLRNGWLHIRKNLEKRAAGPILGRWRKEGIRGGGSINFKS